MAEPAEEAGPNIRRRFTVVRNSGAGSAREPIDAARYALPAIVIIAFLLIWQYVPVWLGVPSYELPNLGATIAGLQLDWGQIGTGLLVTVQDALIGFILGNALAIMGATLFAYSVNIERAFYPIAILVQTIPIIVYVPLLRVSMANIPLLGPNADAWAVVGVTMLITFFPTLVNMNVGFKSIDPRIYELMRLLNASRTQIFVKLRFPSALPFLTSSLRITTTLSFVGALVGEWMAGAGFNGAGQLLSNAGVPNLLGFDTNPANAGGIGGLLNTFNYNVDKPGIFACVLVVSILSVVFFALVVLLERALIPWNRPHS